MILVAGLSPAWQHVLRFARFQVGEVNRALDVHWYGSGKALNVCYALLKLGELPRLISPIGGSAREFIENEFDELGIPARWIGTAAATRICTTILDESTPQTTELVENAGALTASELAEFRQEFLVHVGRAKVVVLSGSLSAGAPLSFFSELLQHTTCRAILDIRGPELLSALDQKPFLIKPNRQELSQTLQRNLDNDLALLDAMQEMRERGAEWVVVTDGARPAWVASPQGNYRFLPAPLSKIVNPIGCGDCLASGLAAGLSQDHDPLHSIRYGFAAAADNVGQLLAARIDAQRVAQFAEQVKIEMVV